MHPPISVYSVIQLTTAATTIVAATTAIVKAAAEKKDYDENDNPR